MRSKKDREDMENKITIVLGTKNQNKVFEMNEITKGQNIEFVLPDGDFNPKEDGETFEQNAKIKALEASKNSRGEYFLADDSGLCVDYLNGAPGIYSARYESSPEKRIQKLLSEIKEDKKRDAHFTCALCLTDKKGNVLHTEVGHVYGKIAYEKKGKNGFGYDPVFIVNNLDKTMAELTSEEKNTLSHRGKAMNKMIEWLNVNLKNKG